MTHGEYLYRAATLRKIWHDGRINGATLAHRLYDLIEEYITCS